ncbi:hypothetical protein PCASD_17544 [Puccinia coronata f. sp. avenae]|uniref:DDE Tnp4 domain-containing protein n=1 Tax=Puccinia coronata f. sp. avenae TaxID=200324 RepID=A0A2N5U3T6_9BASI|nr:hypothetical protein PCASD_17544 [Puccinia coronata f. sp. avenae]
MRPPTSARPATVAPMVPRGLFLIGNAGYPANVNILLPYPSVQNAANQWFNHIQSSTCMVVEQAFGRLKNRFRILLHSQNATPRQARNTTFACLILHNLLNQQGTLYLQDWDERSNQEGQFGELPPTPPETGADILDFDGPNVVSMWTKRNIIRDMLYCS